MASKSEIMREVKILTSCSKETRRRLAVKSGVSETCLDTWFSGNGNPSLSKLCDYLEALGFELSISRVNNHE